MNLRPYYLGLATYSAIVGWLFTVAFRATGTRLTRCTRTRNKFCPVSSWPTCQAMSRSLTAATFRPLESISISSRVVT